jgi:hypothetical protein
VAQAHVDAAFECRVSEPEKYASARRILKTRSRQAYARYRKALRHKLSLDNNGKEWWDIIKQHYGTGGSRKAAAPAPQLLAQYFAEKLSLGGAENDPVPEFAPVNPGKLNSFRVSRCRVKKVLRGLNVYKSVNGISNRFLKNCSNVLTPAITSLYQRIARDATWPTRWKKGRVSAIWKRESKSLPKNYRPVTVLDCLSLCMERTLDPQLDNFLRPFMPGSQYGFTKECGTQDYGAALCMNLHTALEQGLEAILVSLDVAGAFDKVWWAALLANLKHCGMGGRSHRLISSYLHARFLYVVAMGIASGEFEFFCGVPQGAIWSPKFWNFHIREMPCCLRHSISFNYADDSALLKVFGTRQWSADRLALQTTARHRALCEVNEDLKALLQFGIKWKITFEPTKTHAMFVSNTMDCCFPWMSQLIFGDAHVSFEEELKLVGFIFDRKLTWEKMVKKVCSTGRQALGGVRRLKKLLGYSDLAVLYKAFVRSCLEYGNLEYLGAASSHLSKLDRIQSSAERLCNTTFTPLSERREAAAFGLICKLLDGRCVEQLQELCPPLIVVQHDRSSVSGNTRGKSSMSDPQKLTLRLENQQHHRLDGYIRSFGGQMNAIFNKVPADILQQGIEDGWKSAMKPGQRFLGGSRHGNECTLKSGVFEVERVIGFEESVAGRRYQVKWKGYKGEGTWEAEKNLIGAERAVSEFWVKWGEEQPEGVLKSVKRKRTNEDIARSYEAQMNQDLMFRG